MSKKSRKKHQKSWTIRLLKGILFLVLFCFVSLITIYMCAGQIIQKALPEIVSPMTQSSASVGPVDLSLLSGKITIQDLKIGNPKGFSNHNIFELGKIAVSFDPKSVLSNELIIHSIDISGIGVAAEISMNGSTNVGVLNDNIQSYLSNGKPQKPEKKEKKPTAQNQKKEATQQYLLIKDLKVTDSTLKLGVAGQVITIPVPNIHRQNISNKEEKTSKSEMIAKILSYISAESVKAVLTSGSDILQEQLKNAPELLNKGKEKLKEQHKNLTNALKDQTDALKKGWSNTSNSLKGLFK